MYKYPGGCRTDTLGYFPLIRKISTPVSGLIAGFDVTPNQLTTLSLLSGIIAAVCLASERYGVRVGGALLFVLSYILDNCDGDIARLKNLSSRFGEFYDTFCDWLIHAVLFTALGYGEYKISGSTIWLFLGLLASTGATINYLLGFFYNEHQPESTGQDGIILNPAFRDYCMLIFRELSRADFCFIVLVLALLDLTWILIPLTAAGAQVYWMARFLEGSRKFHV